MKNNLALFEEKEIRRVWKNDKWYFSIEDVISVLTDSTNPKDYLKKLRKRDKILNSEWKKILYVIRIDTKGGKQAINFSDTEGILRIIQSIPSSKAEPFKLWLAHVGKERIDEINNPELAIKRMRQIYKKKGYSKSWIDQREKGIITRNNLTDEWKYRGAARRDYAILTNEIYKKGFGLTAKEYKEVKNLEEHQNLRDSMVNIELALTNLGEASAVEIHNSNDSFGLDELKSDTSSAGTVVNVAKKELEKKLNKSIITSKNYIDLTNKRKKLENNKKEETIEK